MNVEVSGVFWTLFPGHHTNLKCFSHSREKQWWLARKSAVFSGYSYFMSTHLQPIIFCSRLQGAEKSHAPSLDQARSIFAWLVLFSRCPYHLRALHRLVNDALMYLKKHLGMHSLLRSSERIPIWCSFGTKLLGRYRAITSDCKLAAPINFIRGNSAGITGLL